MNKEYSDFIKTKMIQDHHHGFVVETSSINESLFDFQKTIVKWALQKGRAAIFADTGLGKTAMQVEWANHVANHTQGNVLILAPLCVAHQTVKEGKKFGIEINYCRSQNGVKAGVNITNYEMMDKFDIGSFSGVVLDESSILKSIDGKTKTSIIESTIQVPFRLSCTATPSPNDYMELGNQSEFLGVMSSEEMLAMFFIHDGGETSKWRLKGHGMKKFWEWMATWAICVKKPSDLNYDNIGYDLPPMKIIKHVVDSERTEGQLFAVMEDGLRGRIKSRRSSLNDRVEKTANIVNASKEQFIVWCQLNDESDSLEKAIHGSKAIQGSDSMESKESAINSFLDGSLRIIISKTSIIGFGLNLQNCHNMIFCGINDSWESYYQAIRRCYRFGQLHEVNVHLVFSEVEDTIMQNLQKKEKQNSIMGEKMSNYMKELTISQITNTNIEKSEYKRRTIVNDNWTMELGDCVDVCSGMKDNSVDYTIFSPPFSSLYVYSNSDYDMGNSKDDDGFYQQFKFLVKELFRITKPGRLVSFHCMNIPSQKARDGVIGIKDFRGDLIRLFSDEGWTFHSEVCIWKDPVIAMQRTKALGLLHKQIKKDSAMSRQGIPDYLVTMRKDGINDNPVSHTDKTFPVDVWQKYASPVWMDINPSDTLQFREARDNDDERHICPLQLGVIQRGIELWSNPGDLVLSPFAGIGSEGYVSLQMGRKFIGVELKESYFQLACRNLDMATKQRTLFNSDLEVAINAIS